MSAPGDGNEADRSPSAGTDYSTAYSEIIGDGDDLIDMIAYCLYKKQKREFILRNRLPFGDARVRNYHEDLNADRIATLRTSAEARLRDYANLIQQAIRDEEGDEIRRGIIVTELAALIDDKHRRITETVRSETVWWKAVLYAIVGGFALGLIIIFANRMGFMNPFEALPKTPPT